MTSFAQLWVFGPLSLNNWEDSGTFEGGVYLMDQQTPSDNAQNMCPSWVNNVL
jgi:hypothetical protein